MHDIGKLVVVALVLIVQALALPLLPPDIKAQLGPGRERHLYEILISSAGDLTAPYLKPAYHLTAPSGWMNDPNGMFEYQGLYHVFYQHNPAGAIWGPPYWGHAVSADLVHWKALPHAIIPDMYYDIDGVFSGSTTILNNGTPAILYTGVSRFSELGYYYQVQALAMPADIHDPELKRWLKYRDNPVLNEVPPGGNYSQWRDPTTAWKQGDRYTMAVGAQQDCVGGAALYTSAEDFTSWQYEGLLYSESALGGDSQCRRTVEHQACDQFSTKCAMWECPDFFELEAGVRVFKYSNQILHREPFGQDWYVLGTYSTNAPLNATKFTNKFNGKYYEPKLWDFGAIYASKTFQLSDGRVLWLGWVYETAVGCQQMCAEGTQFTNAQGWQGAQTLLREVSFAADTGELMLLPIAEMEMLRGAKLFEDTLQLGKSYQVVDPFSFERSSDRHQQLEILLTANITAAQGAANGDDNKSAFEFSFNVGVIILTGPTGSAVISIDGSAEVQDGTVVVTSCQLGVDSSNSGGATQPLVQGGIINLPDNGLPADALELRVFVDHSIVEAYGLGGRGRVTSRMYPLHDPGLAWGVQVFGDYGGGNRVAITADVTVWSLDSCWVEEIQMNKQ